MFYHYVSSDVTAAFPLRFTERRGREGSLMFRILEVPALDPDPKTEIRRVSRFSCYPTQIPGIVFLNEPRPLPWKCFQNPDDG
jgi:hypothetical protein